MALQVKLYRGDSLQVLDLNASHDVMVTEAATLAAMVLWPAGGGSSGSISQVYTTYSFMSLLWAWQFQVIVLASALMVFTVKVYAINTQNREIASKERIAQMQKETELEKTRMKLIYRLLSSQLGRTPQLDAAATLQLLLSLAGPRSLPKRQD